MRPAHGCRCCGLQGRHQEDCLVPVLAAVIDDRYRLHRLIREFVAARHAQDAWESCNTPCDDDAEICPSCAEGTAACHRVSRAEAALAAEAEK